MVPHFSIPTHSSKDRIHASAKQRLAKAVEHLSLFNSKVPVGIRPLFQAKMIPLHQIRQAHTSRDFFKGAVILGNSFHAKALVSGSPIALFASGLKKLFSSDRLILSPLVFAQRTKALSISILPSRTAPVGAARPGGLHGMMVKIQSLLSNWIRSLEGWMVKLFPRLAPAFGERFRTGGQGGRDRTSVTRERMRQALWNKHLHKINKKRVRKPNKKMTQHILKLPNDTWEPLD